MATLRKLDPGVFTIESLFSVEECDDLIRRAESHGFEAAVVRTRSGQKIVPKIRNNDRVVLTDQALAVDMWERAAPMLPLLDGRRAVGVDSTLRFYRYVPGQKFNRHRDGSVTNARGETSRLSYLVYLNACDGGETLFRDYTTTDGVREKIELRVAPSAGTACCLPMNGSTKGCRSRRARSTCSGRTCSTHSREARAPLARLCPRLGGRDSPARPPCGRCAGR